MSSEQTLLCIGILAVLLLLYLRHGGEEDMDALSSRMAKRLSYWYYKISLWWDTWKIKRSYRYITCEHCGCKNRVNKKQVQCRCCACDQPIILRKKGKRS